MAAGPLRGAEQEAGGRAEHLGCGVFVCVSERSWAEAAERISTEGQAGKTSSSSGGGWKKKRKKHKLAAAECGSCRTRC